MSCKHGTRNSEDCWECLFEDDGNEDLLEEARHTLKPGTIPILTPRHAIITVNEGDEDI
jgi:hypothetical protein